MNVDYREYDLIAMFDQQDIQYNKLNLPLGDIHIVNNNDDNLLIERKTLNDFSSSIIDGRYSEQKSRLLNSGAQIVYLIEGTEKNNHGVPLSTLLSTMYTLQSRDNIIVMRSKNLQESVDIIQIISKKFKESSVTQTKPYKAMKKSDNIDVYHSILCCIPGVSSTIASNIQSTFPNLNALLQHINEGNNLQCIDKVGKLLSKKIITNLTESIS